jgi:ABC-type amino acid transport substrate-binding protein
MAGDFDIVLGGLAITPDRMRLVDFSLSYDNSQEPDPIYGLSGAPEPALARIGVQSGTIHETHARSLGWNSFSYGTGTDFVTALRAGSVDLAFGALTNEIAAYPEIQRLFAEDIPDLGTAMAVCRENDALLSKINAALQAMLDDGTIDAITARWL